MNLKDPQEFETDLDGLEQVEQASTRMVAYAMQNILPLAVEEFAAIMRSPKGAAPAPRGATISDTANYLGEDLTRMALDQIGVSRVPDGRLFGAIDYKIAAVSFLPGFAVEHALFVDSKAEKNALNNCRVQITQTSLEVRQNRAGEVLAMQGLVAPVWVTGQHHYLTSTLFVKYHYTDTAVTPGLKRITIACLPHAFLQERYNPTADDGIWNAGPDAPSLGEKFRTRLNFTSLANKASWRVQRILPGVNWTFGE